SDGIRHKARLLPCRRGEERRFPLVLGDLRDLEGDRPGRLALCERLARGELQHHRERRRERNHDPAPPRPRAKSQSGRSTVCPAIACVQSPRYSMRPSVTNEWHKGRPIERTPCTRIEARNVGRSRSPLNVQRSSHWWTALQAGQTKTHE